MATTPYPFVSGAVLTASQLNSTYNVPVSTKTASYTLVAADGGTRVTMNSASNTTITVNTGLFAAGDSVLINNTAAGGTCTITAGTATVTSSGSLALTANAGGTLYFTSASAAIFFAAGVTAAAGTAANAVTTSQATTSLTYTDLATVGPAVTITTGTNALVTIQTIGAGAVSNRQFMSFAVSGATTVAAGTYEQGVTTAGDIGFRVSSFVVALTAGSNVFTCKYKSSDGNSIAYAQRVIRVTPL